MALDKSRPRGAPRKPKRLNTMPIDRGRITDLEQVAQEQEPSNGP